MGESEKTVYRLYALPYGAAGVKSATQERFSRISDGYVLIYTAGEAPTGSAEITEDEIRRLSAADSRWLFDCNMVLLGEDARKREKEIIGSMNERLEKLEAALEQIAQKEGVG